MCASVASCSSPANYCGQQPMLDAPKMQSPAFEVRPSDTGVGAEVLHLDLSKPLDEAAYEKVSAALDTFSVVCFRDQVLTPEQHIAFSRRFGSLQVNVRSEFNKLGFPEIYIVSNVVVAAVAAKVDEERGRIAAVGTVDPNPVVRDQSLEPSRRQQLCRNSQPLRRCRLRVSQVVPLPPSRPRSVPLPRPRPVSERPQALAEPRSFFDFFKGR
jgi:hypothetical protein